MDNFLCLFPKCVVGFRGPDDKETKMAEILHNDKGKMVVRNKVGTYVLEEEYKLAFVGSRTGDRRTGGIPLRKYSEFHLTNEYLLDKADPSVGIGDQPVDIEDDPKKSDPKLRFEEDCRPIENPPVGDWTMDANNQDDTVIVDNFDDFVPWGDGEDVPNDDPMDDSNGSPPDMDFGGTEDRPSNLEAAKTQPDKRKAGDEVMDDGGQTNTHRSSSNGSPSDMDIGDMEDRSSNLEAAKTQPDKRKADEAGMCNDQKKPKLFCRMCASLLQCEGIVADKKTSISKHRDWLSQIVKTPDQSKEHCLVKDDGEKDKYTVHALCVSHPKTYNAGEKTGNLSHLQSYYHNSAVDLSFSKPGEGPKPDVALAINYAFHKAGFTHLSNNHDKIGDLFPEELSKTEALKKIAQELFFLASASVYNTKKLFKELERSCVQQLHTTMRYAIEQTAFDGERYKFYADAQGIKVTDSVVSEDLKNLYLLCDNEPELKKKYKKTKKKVPEPRKGKGRKPGSEKKKIDFLLSVHKTVTETFPKNKKNKPFTAKCMEAYREHEKAVTRALEAQGRAIEEEHPSHLYALMLDVFCGHWYEKSLVYSRETPYHSEYYIHIELQSPVAHAACGAGTEMNP